MASLVPQFDTWHIAKNLSRKLQFDEALELYRSIESDMLNLENWHGDKSDSEKDKYFYQAMFFGDYCGLLCNIGHYADAKAKSDIALKFLKLGNFTTLKYIYYNIGNIYLFQKKYSQACLWFEKALEGATYFYTSVNEYLVNYGISKFYLNQIDEAKEIFQLAITQSKGTKYNKSIEPFYYMAKIHDLQNNTKESERYKKMYITRLKKYSKKELDLSVCMMEEQEKILIDYTSLVK